MLTYPKDIDSLRERAEKLRKVFASYPGISGNVDELISKMLNNPRSSVVAFEIENHIVKHFNYYPKVKEGFEGAEFLISYLVDCLNKKEIAGSTIKSLLRISLKLIEEYGGEEHDRFLMIVHGILKTLSEIDISEELPKLDSLRVIGKTILKREIKDKGLIEAFKVLLKKYLIALYDSIGSISNPAKYFKDYFFQGYPFVERAFNSFYEELIKNKNKIKEAETLEELVSIPTGIEIFSHLREIHRQFINPGDPWLELQNRIYYFFWITENPQLSEIFDFSIREIGKSIKNFLKNAKEFNRVRLAELLERLFIYFEQFFNRLPDAVLFALEEVSEGLFSFGDRDLTTKFNELLINLGFQLPETKGFSEEYIVSDNRNHLRNLRLWFEIISKAPSDSKDLIAALSIYLYFGGVHIKDTDFFQRDVTKLLNSDISHLFYLLKPILLKLPVYFNEINAEGQLRTVSTEVDEIYRRKDPLIHFIRKQIHVESSPLVVELLRETFNFWITGETSELRRYVPSEITRELENQREHYKELGELLKFLLAEYKSLDELILSPLDLITSRLNSQRISNPTIKSKLLLSIRLYQLLYSKYKINYCELEQFLKETIYMGLPDGSHLIEIFAEESLQRKIEALLSYLEELKEIIFSPQKFEAFEDIAHKRHIVAGIPSVYGRYSERKFNALSVFLRLENILQSFLDEIEQSIDLELITRATLFRIERYLKIFLRVLELNGLSSQRFINTLHMLTVALEIRRFTFSQYMDIFRNLSESIGDIVNTYCTAPYKKWLPKIIPKIYNLSDRNPQDSFEFVNSNSEKFLRDVVTRYPGLSQLDRLIGRIIKTAYNQAEKLKYSELDLLMTYDPMKIICDIYAPRKEINDRIHLGNKGHNLIKLTSMGIPVPPGFILTTEVFRCRDVITRFEPAKAHFERELKYAMKRLETASKRKFNDPSDPLLVSVRSGGAISMPGMMNSFLNVGMNEEIAEGLCKRTGKPWAVWDSYRRFLQCWGMSFGLDRDEFDNIINFYKKKYRVDYKILFTPAQMKEVALAYREFILSMGIKIEDDPWRQLTIAINQVLNSWFSTKAKTYREILGISEDWGTAVVIQKMVFGNLDTNAGSGVLFTKNPKEPSDRLVLWGDYTPGTQGEDIVSGLVNTYPISIEQKLYENRKEKSLEESFPEIYEALLEIAKNLLYREKWEHQEIEFTFEGRGKSDLYILQAREMSYSKGEMITVFIPTPALNESKLGTGIGVSGGALSGRIVFDVDDIKSLKKDEPDTPVILVRSDTVPDDIAHIAHADGILTARGGSTSHASIIATKLGKTCVVGFSKMSVYQGEKKCKIGKRTLKKGDFISIDGRSGLVFLGKHPTHEIYLSTEYL